MKRKIILLMGVVLIFVFCFCGCNNKVEDWDVVDDTNQEQKEETTEKDSEKKEDTVPEDDYEKINLDVNLKRIETEIDGQPYIIDIIGKQSETSDYYGVKEIHVYQGSMEKQLILMRDIIPIDGEDGIGPGYTQCVSEDASANLKDVNFDGYLDLEVCAWVPNNSIPYYYFCWNNETQKFDYSFCLQLTVIDTMDQYLVSTVKENAETHKTTYYKVDENNKLIEEKTRVDSYN